MIGPIPIIDASTGRPIRGRISKRFYESALRHGVTSFAQFRCKVSVTRELVERLKARRFVDVAKGILR